jgi:hypothetical protein
MKDHPIIVKRGENLPPRSEEGALDRLRRLKTAMDRKAQEKGKDYGRLVCRVQIWAYDPDKRKYAGLRGVGFVFECIIPETVLNVQDMMKAGMKKMELKLK